MNKRAGTSGLAARLARLAIALALTAAQSAVAAHVHEISRPVAAASVRRADAQDAHAQCPVCRLAGHARAAVSACTPFRARPTCFVLSSPRSPQAVSALRVRAGARGPPASA